jgi:xanthine/CO dehydrogenase XdhC/CoxF family maturation factor
MDILRCASAHEHWQPLDYGRAARRGVGCRVAFVTASRDAALPLGLWVSDTQTPPNGSVVDSKLLALRSAAGIATGNTLVRVAQPDVEIFVGTIAPPAHLLLLGGGPDARPVAELAAFLGWRVTVVDHRPAYLDPARFPANTMLVETPAADVADAVTLEDFSAAIVMSHHLDSDLQYLRALAATSVPYVGLLGPAARRERLLSELGDPVPSLRARLRAPVGLDIGGRAPESIALSIIGEVHAALAGRGGRPFTETANE